MSFNDILEELVSLKDSEEDEINSLKNQLIDKHEALLIASRRLAMEADQYACNEGDRDRLEDAAEEVNRLTGPNADRMCYIMLRQCRQQRVVRCERTERL